MFLKPENSALLAELTKRLHPDHSPSELTICDVHISDFDGETSPHRWGENHPANGGKKRPTTKMRNSLGLPRPTYSLVPPAISINFTADTHFRLEVLDGALNTVRVSMCMAAYKQLEG